MSDNVKIIEFESVKKGKNVLFISLICAAAALAVLFLVLWIFKPAAVDPGSVRKVEFTGTAGGGQTLNEEVVDGKTVYVATAGRSYTFSATLLGDGGIALVNWNITPADSIRNFSAAADPENPSTVLCTFTAGSAAGAVTISAVSNDQELGTFAFEIRDQFVETLSVQSVKNAVTSASFPLESADGLSVKVPYFPEHSRERFNVVAIESLMSAKYELSDYLLNGKNINALSYTLVCDDGSARIVTPDAEGTDAQVEILKTGSSKLLIRANQNNAWRDIKDCLVELQIEAVPLSDSSMQFILSEIGLKSGVARQNDEDEFPTIELFLHETNFYLHYNSAYEERNNLALYPLGKGFSLKTPREVYANGQDRAENDRLFGKGSLTEFRLSPLKAGETYLLFEESDAGYGAQLMVRVFVYRPVTQVVNDAAPASSALNIVSQAGADSTVTLRYTVNNVNDTTVPTNAQIKSAMYFYYPSASLEPLSTADGRYDIKRDKEAYKHTAVADGMFDTGIRHETTGLKLFCIQPDLTRSSQNAVAVLKFSTGTAVNPTDIMFSFYLENQHRTTRPSPQPVQFSVKVTVTQTVEGLRFNFEHFNRLAAATMGGTFLYALDNAGNPVTEPQTGAFYTSAVLVHNIIGENNALARFSIYDLLRYFDATAQEFGTRIQAFKPTEQVAGLTVTRVSGGTEAWPFNLSSSGDYGRFIERNTIPSISPEYQITITAPSKTIEGGLEETAVKLTLRVEYRDEIHTLRLDNSAARTVSYLYSAANPPKLGNTSTDTMRVIRRYNTNPTVARVSDQYLNIFINSGGTARMLYRYPQAGGAGTEYRYYDYDYSFVTPEPDRNDALFTRAASGEVSINRDLYLYSYQNILAGRPAFDEFELIYTVEQLYNSEEPGKRYEAVVTPSQSARGYTADSILQISHDARVTYQLVRLFDTIEFFNSSHERITSALESPKSVMSGFSDRIYASGVIGGLNVVYETQKHSAVSTLKCDSLSALELTGGVTKDAGSGEYRFIGDSVTQQPVGARLSVTSTLANTTATAYFSVQFKTPMPIRDIAVFRDEARTDEVADSDSLRLAINHSAPDRNMKKLYLRVIYDGSALGFGDYETFDGIYLQRVGGIGEAAITASYSSGSDYLMSMIPNPGGGYQNTVMSGTDFIREYVLTLTAEDGFADKEDTFCIVPKYGAGTASSVEFNVRVTTYAESIEVRTGSNATVTTIALVMKDAAMTASATVYLKQLAGGSIAGGLYHNYVYNYKVFVPNGSGGFIEDASAVNVSINAQGKVTVSTNGKIISGAKIQFTLTYQESGGGVDTFAEVLDVEVGLDVAADVYKLELGAEAGKLPITIAGATTTQPNTVGQTDFIINEGNASYVPLQARYTVSYTVKRNGTAVTIAECPFALSVSKTALSYIVPNTLTYADSLGYQVFISVQNEQSGTTILTQFDLVFSTLDYTLAFEQVFMEGDASKAFAIGSDSAGNPSVSVFTQLNEKVRFEAVARNAWTNAILTGAELPTAVSYAETGTGAEFESENNLKITSLDTELFEVTAECGLGAAKRSASIAVSKFNRIADLVLVAEAQMPKPLLKTAVPASGADFELTLVQSGTQKASADLTQYLRVSGVGAIAPFADGFTSEASGDTVTISGNTITAKTPGSVLVTVTAETFGESWYTDPVIAATKTILVTVTEFSVSADASLSELNFGQSNSFSFDFLVLNGVADFDLSGHEVEYSIRESGTNYIDLLTGSASGSTYTVTVQSLKKNLGAIGALTFDFECTVDGVTVTDTVVCPVKLFNGTPDFELTHAGGGNLAVSDGKFQMDYQLDQTAKVVFAADVLDQINRLEEVEGLTVAYTFTSSDSGILQVLPDVYPYDPMISATGGSRYGTVELKLTMVVSGKTYVKSVWVDVFNSAKIQTKVFAGGTLTALGGGLYQLSGQEEIENGESLEIGYGLYDGGILSARKIYLAAQFDPVALSGFNLTPADFTPFVSSTALRATGVSGFISGGSGERYYFAEYEPVSVTAAATAVKLRATARLGSYYYTSDVDVTLTATAPVLDFKAASTGAISTAPGNTHNVSPTIANLADAAGEPGFYGNIRTVYEWTSYNIEAGGLEIVDGVLTVAPRIQSGFATLRITVFVESGAFTGWSDGSLSKTVTVTVTSSGAPVFEQKSAAVITPERADTGNTITVDLFGDYIEFDIPDAYEHVDNYNLTPAIIELGYAEAGTTVEDLTGTVYGNKTFDLELPNSVFYLKLSVTLDVTGGEWAGYSKTLIFSFYVSPKNPSFTLSGNGVNRIKSAYVQDGKPVAVTGVSTGGTVMMNTAVEDTLLTAPYSDHYVIWFSAAEEYEDGRVSAKGNLIQGIGYIDGNRFVTDAGGRGGAVYLYAVIEFTEGPYKGLQFEFSEEVFVFSLSALSDTVTPGADFSVTKDGVFIRSGKSVNLKTVLESGSYYQRIPQNKTNILVNIMLLQSAASIDAGFEKPSYLRDSNGVVSVMSGAYYRSESSPEEVYLNLGPILQLSLQAKRDNEIFDFCRVVNLYIMPEELPTASVISDTYRVAGKTAAQVNQTGTATVYAGDIIEYGISAEGSAIQKIDLYIQKDGQSAVLGMSALSDAVEGLSKISYTVPSSLASGTYSAYVVVTISGYTSTSELYGKKFIVGTPDTFGGLFSVVSSENQLFTGSETTFTLTQQSGAAAITRVKLVYPQVLTFATGESRFTATLKDGMYTAFFDAADSTAVSTLSWAMRNTANATTFADVSITVYTHTATNITGSYRYDGGFALQLLADSELATMLQPASPADRYSVTTDQVLQLNLTGTRLDYANMKNVVYSVTKAGQDGVLEPRVVLETDGSGNYPLGYVCAKIVGAPSSAPITVKITLERYDIGGKTFDVNSSVLAEFIPFPLFSVTKDDANSTITVTSNKNIAIAGYELLSGSNHITEGTVVTDTSGTSATFSFKPHYIASGASNKLTVRLTVVITETDVFEGREFALDPGQTGYDYANMVISNPFPAFAVSETGRGDGLKLSGTLSTNASGAAVRYSVDASDYGKFQNGTAYPSGTSGSFTFLQKAVNETVRVTVTAESGAASYTTYYTLTNYAVPAPEFSAGEQTGNSFQVTGNVAFAISSAQAVSGGAFAANVTYQNSTENSVQFAPRFDSRGANAAVIRVTLTVTDTESPYLGQTYNIIKDVTVSSVLTGAITETIDRSQETAIADRLTGGLVVPVPEGATVSFATANAAQYFSEFDEETGEFKFKESLVELRRTVIVTVTYGNGIYVYDVELTNYAIEIPVFTVIADSEAPYGFIITGEIGGTDYALSSSAVSVTPRVLSGAGFMAGFSSVSFESGSAKFSLTPHFKAGEAKFVVFEITVKILDADSAYFNRSFVVRYVNEGEAEEAVTVEIKNDLGVDYAPGEDITETRDGTESVEAQHKGTLTVAVDADKLAEVKTVTFNPDNANLFESPSFVAQTGASQVSARFNFKRLTANVSTVVTIRFEMNSGATYTYDVTLYNDALDIPEFEIAFGGTNPYAMTLTGKAGDADALVDMTKVGVTFELVSGGGYVYSAPAMAGTASSEQQVWKFVPNFIAGGYNRVEYRVVFRILDTASDFYNQSFAVSTGEIVILNAFSGIAITDSRSDALRLKGEIEISGADAATAVAYRIAENDRALFKGTSYPDGTDNTFEFLQHALNQTVTVYVTLTGANGYYTYSYELINYAVAAPVFTAVQGTGSAVYSLTLSGTAGSGGASLDMTGVTVAFELVSGGGYVHTAPAIVGEPAAGSQTWKFVPQFIDNETNTVRYRITFTVTDTASPYYGQTFAVTKTISITDAFAGILVEEAARSGAFGLSGEIEVSGVEGSESVTFRIAENDRVLFAGANYPDGENGAFEFKQSAAEKIVTVYVTVYNGYCYYTYETQITNTAIAAPVFTAAVQGNGDVWVSGTVGNDVSVDMTQITVHLRVLSGAPFMAGSVVELTEESDSDYTKFTFPKKFTQGIGTQGVLLEAVCVPKADSEYTHKGMTFSVLADPIEITGILEEAVTDERDTGNDAATRLSGTIIIPQNPAQTVTVSVSETDKLLFEEDYFPGNEANQTKFIFLPNMTGYRQTVRVTVTLESEDGSIYTYFHTLVNEPFPAFELVGSHSGVNGLVRLRSDSVTDAMYAADTFRFSVDESDQAKLADGFTEGANPAVFKFAEAYGTKTLDITVTFTLNASAPFPGEYSYRQTITFVNFATFAIEVQNETMSGGQLRLTAFDAGEDVDFSIDFEGVSLSFEDVSVVNGAAVVGFDKIPQKTGGTVTVTVTMHYGDGLTMERSVQIYVAPTVPQFVFGEEEFDGDQTYSIEIKLVTVPGENGEAYTLDDTPGSYQVMAVSGIGLITDMQTVLSDGNVSIVFSYKKASTPIAGSVTLLVTARASESGVAAGPYYGTYSYITVEAEILRIIEVADGEFYDSLTAMQKGYSLQKWVASGLSEEDGEEDGGEEPQGEWVDIAIPGTWSVQYVYTAVQNGANLLTWVETDGSGRGILSYLYHSLSSNTVSFTVAARITVNESIYVTDSIAGQVEAWQKPILTVPVSSFVGSGTSKTITVTCKNWIMASYLSETWYSSIASVTATRSGSAITVATSTLHTNGIFTISYGSTTTPNNPAFLYMTINLDETLFSSSVRTYTISFSIVCANNNAVTLTQLS